MAKTLQLWLYDIYAKINETLTGTILATGTNTIGKVVITDSGGDAETHSSCLQTLDYVDAVGHGLIAGYTTEFAVGKKSSITTGAFTILESDDFIQPPTAGGDIQMYVQSSSVEDGVGGTGLKTFVIEYFSLAWGARKTQTVTMNGTTQVPIPNIDKYRIHAVYGTIGRPAVGTITITNIGETILYGGILQYDTYMKRCIFYLAENETVLITQAFIGSTTSGGVNIVCFVSEEDVSENIITRGRATVEIADNSAPFDFKPFISISNPNNLRKAVGLSVKGSAPSQKCTATLRGIIEV